MRFPGWMAAVVAALVLLMGSRSLVQMGNYLVGSSQAMLTMCWNIRIKLHSQQLERMERFMLI